MIIFHYSSPIPSPVRCNVLVMCVFVSHHISNKDLIVWTVIADVQSSKMYILSLFQQKRTSLSPAQFVWLKTITNRRLSVVISFLPVKPNSPRSLVDELINEKLVAHGALLCLELLLDATKWLSVLTRCRHNHPASIPAVLSRIGLYSYLAAFFLFPSM